VEELKKRGKKVRAIIMDADFPEEIAKDITVRRPKATVGDDPHSYSRWWVSTQEAYKKLDSMYKEEDQVDVAVRSSATAEDLPEASFAGQQGPAMPTVVVVSRQSSHTLISFSFSLSFRIVPERCGREAAAAVLQEMHGIVGQVHLLRNVG
jgi:phosphoenolpyruvate synthase/pyruvate phosphate dikinase